MRARPSRKRPDLFLERKDNLFSTSSLQTIQILAYLVSVYMLTYFEFQGLLPKND
jgi:hypothetical protein